MRISGVNRSSTVAWGASSEHSSLLAAGTVAGAISDNFDRLSRVKVSIKVEGRGVPMPSV